MLTLSTFCSYTFHMVFYNYILKQICLKNWQFFILKLQILITDVVYTFFHEWPQSDHLEVAVLHKYLQETGTIKMLGNQEELQVNILHIHFTYLL